MLQQCPRKGVSPSRLYVLNRNQLLKLGELPRTRLLTRTNHKHKDHISSHPYTLLINKQSLSNKSEINALQRGQSIPVQSNQSFQNSVYSGNRI